MTHLLKIADSPHASRGLSVIAELLVNFSAILATRLLRLLDLLYRLLFENYKLLIAITVTYLWTGLCNVCIDSLVRINILHFQIIQITRRSLSQSPLVSPSIIPSLFHSTLKTYLFHQSFPSQAPTLTVTPFLVSYAQRSFALVFLFYLLLARDAFLRTNRRTTAMMFVRLSVWDRRAL